MLLIPQPKVQVLFHAGAGKDQLGNIIGKPQPGDIAKVHVKMSYIANRPLLKIGIIRIGKEKPRKTEFLSTSIIGETAFFEVHISKNTESCSSFDDILSAYVSQMMLGETSRFTFELDEKTRNLFTRSLHKGHYQNIPDAATGIRLEIDSYRIVRGNNEYRRPNRNGTGAAMPGSFAM